MSRSASRETAGRGQARQRGEGGRGGGGGEGGRGGGERGRRQDISLGENVAGSQKREASYVVRQEVLEDGSGWTAKRGSNHEGPHGSHSLRS